MHYQGETMHRLPSQGGSLGTQASGPSGGSGVLSKPTLYKLTKQSPPAARLLAVQQSPAHDPWLSRFNLKLLLEIDPKPTCPGLKESCSQSSEKAQHNSCFCFVLNCTCYGRRVHEHYITEFSQKIGDFSDDGVVPDSEQRTKVAASAADRSP